LLYDQKNSFANICEANQNFNNLLLNEDIVNQTSMLELYQVVDITSNLILFDISYFLPKISILLLLSKCNKHLHVLVS